MIKVIAERCPEDHLCPAIKMCPVKAIYQNGFNAPSVDNDKRIGRQACVANCPQSVFEADWDS
ncbi:4Fe-4S ferredoxin [Candidatus Woesearchaeota archaeon]|nr:4Fe-4S ferredoxin [Candidatus Woesearchaeota archaeon]